MVFQVTPLAASLIVISDEMQIVKVQEMMVRIVRAKIK
jgi:hypothetical protein